MSALSSSSLDQGMELSSARVDLAQAPAMRWERLFARRLAMTDLAVVIWAVFGSELLWFGTLSADVTIAGRLSGMTLSYTAVSVLVVVLWMLSLSIYQTRDPKALGAGSAEYMRVFKASFTIFGAGAIVAYLLKIELARGYFLLALPLGLVTLLLTRWLWRKYLVQRRQYGEYSAKVLLVGGPQPVATIGLQLAAQPAAGYSVVGACIDEGVPGTLVPGTDIPVLGRVVDALDVLEASGADTVVATASRHLTPRRLRKLSWGLEPGHKQLVMAPALVDVAGPRIHSRPVAGLPLVHVETPRYSGAARTLKRASDLIGAGLLVVVLSPVLIVAAIAVRVDSAGPVLFRQERVGINGSRFAMLKFRSMVVDAERHLAEVQAARAAAVVEAGNDVMFKMTDDPRITRVGRTLRRYSIDELPQLFNVLKGDMSLVGPRPPLPREVAQYEQDVRRKFLVRPGITGLWQVSGRSNLSWEETVRLDLYYVENWSVMADLQILFRTAKAVLAREGAY